MSEPSATRRPSIRPAATLLLIRDGAMGGVEVLGLKRAATMRFLPGYVSFPGGAVDAADLAYAAAWPGAAVTAQEHPDDPGYAVASLRECAEEVGWLCAVNGVDETARDEALPEVVQERLLAGEVTFADLLRMRHTEVAWRRLRYVGRWVTPPGMPARFDTRFFLYVCTGDLPLPRVNPAEHEWAAWLNPARALADIEAGRMAAVPPTLAMLRAIASLPRSEEGFRALHVPGPPPQP
ncbi:MAG: NUDIX hydrolase [Alicyclobacillus sp.]|nr:NUDIX hydrolase [Alicyclobacillus sp.]